MFLDRGHWAKTQYLLEKGMDVAVERRKVIADNMANVDVPHFKRSEVSFEAQLRRALDHAEYVARNEVPAKMTDSKHIPFFRSMNYQDVGARKHLDYLSTMRNDGNNVDPEHEVGEALKNQLAYQAYTTAINNNFKMLNIVLRSA